MKPSSLSVPATVVEETLAFLRHAGDRGSEAVVLWLGRRGRDRVIVAEAYVPEQEVAWGSFRIPPSAMSALLAHLGDTGTFVAAQVHSHPRKAFHSDADDMWAIVRHLGALSLVVPYFGRGTSVGRFLHQIAAFRLSATNRWQELGAADLEQSVVIS